VEMGGLLGVLRIEELLRVHWLTRICRHQKVIKALVDARIGLLVRVDGFSVTVFGIVGGGAPWFWIGTVVVVSYHDVEISNNLPNPQNAGLAD
jgi:hypothetical protein